jgi:hypothetical protein
MESHGLARCGQLRCDYVLQRMPIMTLLYFTLILIDSASYLGWGTYPELFGLKDHKLLSCNVFYFFARLLSLYPFPHQPLACFMLSGIYVV